MRQMTQQDMIDIRENFPFFDCLLPPSLEVSPEEAAAFDQLYHDTLEQGPAAEIQYTLPYPKYLFLEHLAQAHGLLLHGSPILGLNTLNPIRQSRDSREFGDQTAIYATQDPLWALFFAVLDKGKLQGVISNGAIHLKEDSGSYLRRYFYCLDEPSLRTNPWQTGAIYLMPSAGFEPDPDQLGVRLGIYTLQVTHWIYRGSLTPLAWLAVEPEDFPFLHKLWGYDLQEMDRRMSAESLAGWPFLTDRKLYPVHPLDAE